MRTEIKEVGKENERRVKAFDAKFKRGTGEDFIGQNGGWQEE